MYVILWSASRRLLYDSCMEQLPEGKEELTGCLSQVLNERLDELWESGVLDQERLDEVRGMHLRTELFL